jgi:hypothetical protein
MLANQPFVVLTDKTITGPIRTIKLPLQVSIYYHENKTKSKPAHAVYPCEVIIPHLFPTGISGEFYDEV